MIELKDVSFAYFENQLVIENLSVKFKKGEITALFGFNGSGKSTLLQLIAGRIVPLHGLIKIKSNNIVLKRNELLKKFEEVVLMDQDYKLKPSMTVLENLNYALLNNDQEYKSKRINTIIELCDLTHLLDRKPNQLSGGQEQRAAFACAISTEPALILMDEPFSNLDINTRTEFLSFVKKTINDTKATLIMVSHDPQDTFAVADQLIILQDGKIVQQDKPIKIYKKPENLSVAHQFGIINHFSGDTLKKIFPSENYESEKNYGIWPENIKIKKKGVEGLIEKIIFKGCYNLMLIELNKMKLYVCDFKREYKVGEKISIQFEKENIFKFANY